MGTMQQCPLRVFAASACVVERDGSDAFTDAPPDIAPLATAYTTPGGVCRSGGVVLPLSADKQEVRSAIDNLTAGGASAPHLGAAWAWYLLSPNWSSVFSTPVADYNDGKVKKFAVLMTDGEYNTIGGYQSNGNIALSSQTAVDTCNAMKAKGIVIYTVGFKLDNQLAIDTLKACASNSQSSIRAEDGNQLRGAFQTIAMQINSLRISK